MFRKMTHSVAVACLATGLACSSKPAQQAADPLPTYQEGGSLELSMNGLPVSVKITDAVYANTDEGHPDLIELTGPDTYIEAQVEPKAEDGPDGLSDYKPILNKPFNLGAYRESQPLTIALPGQGKYDITGGSITLTKYDHGMEGRVLWEGTIDIAVDTAAGPATLPGTFKFGIVPVW